MEKHFPELQQFLHPLRTCEKVLLIELEIFSAFVSHVVFLAFFKERICFDNVAPDFTKFQFLVSLLGFLKRTNGFIKRIFNHRHNKKRGML